MSSSDPRDALSDILHNLQLIFKRYDRSARKRAWGALENGPGKAEVHKLLDSPTKTIVGTSRFLNFKEWITQS